MPDIVNYIGRAVGWLRGLLCLLKTEKRIAGEDVGVSLENLKKLLDEQLAKETNPEKRQALEDKLKEADAALRGYYTARLKSALERSDLPPYATLVADGERVLKPENKAKLTEAVTHLELLPPPVTADDFMASANANYALERYDEALADYNQALELRPDYPEALTNRGVTHDDLERYDEALADYNQALELRPDYPDALTNRGVAYRKLERYQEALADYNRALELIPDHPQTLNNRGVTYDSLKRYDEALADYNRALGLRPDHPGTLTNRGITYLNMERYEEALADHSRALELRPDHPEILYNRGNTYLNMERYEDALADYNQALQLKADHTPAVYNIACLFSLTGKLDDAIYHLEKAIGLDPVYRQKAKADTDFDNIRDDPRFKKLIEGD